MILFMSERLYPPGPLGALGVGCVAAGLILALLLDLGPALHHVVLHVMDLLAGGALALVLCPTNLRPTGGLTILK